MFSKAAGLVLGKVALAVLLSGVLVNCAKENDKSNLPIEVSLKTTGACVSGIGQRVSDFVDGKLNAREIGEFWDCLSGAIAEFQRITTGDLGDSYSPQALRQFLQKYFIKDRAVSDELMLALMELKRVILSGTAQSVTRAELSRLQELLAQFKSLSLMLEPHAKILFLGKPEATDVEVRAAASAMQSAVKVLGTWLYQRQQPYSFTQFARLIDSVKEWVELDGKKSTSLAGLKQALVLLPEAKRLILAGDLAGIGGQEWLSLANVLGKTYYFYLATHYSFVDNVEAGFSRQVLPESLNELVDILSQATQAHPQGLIPLTEFHAFFDRLAATSWLSKDFTAHAFDEMLKWLLRRPLGDGVTNATDFSGDHVAELRKHLERWLILIRAPGAVTSTPLVTHFNQLLKQSPAMEWDHEGRLLFRAHPPRAWSEDSRRHLIMPYVVMRMLKEAYTQEPGDFIIHSEMDEAVGEVLPLLQNFGWLLTSNMSLSNKRFREADMFTLAGNGDDRLDLGEAVRYVEFVTSAFRSAQVWLQTAESVCGSREAVCLRNLAFAPGSGVLDGMPRLKGLLNEWGRERFLVYMTNADHVANGHVTTGEYTTAELLQTYQLFEYAETYMQRFDFDASEVINIGEGLASYPVYGPTINNLMMGGAASEDLVKSIFTFMLKYGNTPDNMFGGLLLFANWQMHKDSWVLNTERDNLMSILAELSKR